MGVLNAVTIKFVLHLAVHTVYIPLLCVIIILIKSYLKLHHDIAYFYRLNLEKYDYLYVYLILIIPFFLSVN